MFVERVASWLLSSRLATPMTLGVHSKPEWAPLRSPLWTVRKPAVITNYPSPCLLYWEMPSRMLTDPRNKGRLEQAK